MFVLKRKFEDFLVEEVYKGDILSKGPFLLVKMKKTNWNTLHAVEQIAKRLRIPLRAIGYAGLKDKQGTTTQYLSIHGKTWEQVDFLRIKDIELTFAGYVTSPIGLGSNMGNKFSLRVRNLEESLVPIPFLINYFDDQRFGGKRPNTHIIGKLLLQGHFEEAAKILLTASYPGEEKEHQEFRQKLSWPDIDPAIFPTYLMTEKKFTEYLHKYPRDYRGAFFSLPRRLLTLYIHAYQSFLFNKILDKHIEEIWGYMDIIGKQYSLGICSEKELPVIGFDYSGKNAIALDVLKEEGITVDHFAQEEALKMHTSSRVVQIPLSLSIGPLDNDEEFPSKYCQWVEFILPAGSYATAVIKQMDARSR